MVTKTVEYWHRSKENNGIRNSDTNPSIYGQQIFDKRVKNAQ